MLTFYLYDINYTLFEINILCLVSHLHCLRHCNLKDINKVTLKRVKAENVLFVSQKYFMISYHILFILKLRMLRLCNIFFPFLEHLKRITNNYFIKLIAKKSTILNNKI